MALRKKKQEEQPVEGGDEGEAVEEAQPAATEFVPEASAKPKSNVYTTLLILAFLAFLTGSFIAGNEAWQHYDVQFFGVFSKGGKGGGGGDTGGGSGGGTPTTNPTTNPESTTPPATPPMK